MIENIDLAKTIYPEWSVIVYLDDTVPLDVVEKMKEKATVVNVKSLGLRDMPGMFWRFLVHDREDCSEYLIRDSDSRLSMREKEAVEEWIKSGKNLHIMRDHPHHRFCIMGGMWGLKKTSWKMKDSIEAFLENKKFSTASRNLDQDFLKEVIYAGNRNSMCVHSSIDFINDGGKPFPSPLQDFRFVGDQIKEDGTREYQYSLWKDLKEKRP